MDSRGQHVIFYGIIALAIAGAIAVLTINGHVSESALTVSSVATTTLATTTEPIASSTASTTQAATSSNPRIITSGPMTFELSVSEAEKEKGLGDRANVPDNYAMLFEFPKADRYGFWMKDMKVSLDIVWLSNTGTVVGIVPSIAPSTYPSAVYPPQAVSYVAETKAGFMAEHGVKIGDHFPNLPALPIAEK